MYGVLHKGEGRQTPSARGSLVFTRVLAGILPTVRF